MSGDTRFVELVERHERELHRYLFRMTGSREDAADAFQETFLRAFKAFPRLSPDSNHRAWLYRIAHRQALNLFRSRKSRAVDRLDPRWDVEDVDHRPDRMAETRRLASSLRSVLRELSPRQRSALLLRKYEGLAYAEVAEILGGSVENARAQVSLAMKRVRQGLDSGARKETA